MVNIPSPPPTDISQPLPRRAALVGGWRLGLGAGALLLSGCASLLQREPVRVDVVGVEPLPGEGLELRLALKLRVTNPNDNALDFDGLSVTLDVRGSRFASGVSNERGSVPRFGEAVIGVPVSVSALSLVRQAMGVASGSGPTDRVEYVLRGRLSGTALGGVSFTSSGELMLPKGLGLPGR
ncbi:LEA type 2 family protein [uncultured Aquabacterium sp.]|uniref:LEA type 2 family protein n=1 Tax=uncultured Aquabacterium sp. TaxID=158753 RepID=UPI0030D42DE9